MLILLIVKDSLWALTSLLSGFRDTECWEIPWHLNIVYESHLRYSVIKLTYNLYQKNGNFKSSFTLVFLFLQKKRWPEPEQCSYQSELVSVN